jgi:hypothetical protein
MILLYFLYLLYTLHSKKDFNICCFFTLHSVYAKCVGFLLTIFKHFLKVKMFTLYTCIFFTFVISLHFDFTVVPHLMIFLVIRIWDLTLLNIVLLIPYWRQ